MILTKIAEKLEQILNSPTTTVDGETIQNPVDYQFLVRTAGFHLDGIFDKETGKNVIPVFISQLGGQYNPVPSLKQGDYTIPITFYFPVRFKEDMEKVGEYLKSAFVGTFNTYGNVYARSNLSIPQWGEIQNLDLKQFKEWADQEYHRTFDIREPYLSMQLTLYLSKAAQDLIYGDAIKITNLVIKYKGTTILTDTSPISIERADIGSSESAQQQTFNETFSKGYPASLSFTKQLPLIVKNNASYRELINVCENLKDVENLTVEIDETFPFANAVNVTNNYYVTNYSRRTAYGSLFGISLTLADRRDD